MTARQDGVMPQRCPGVTSDGQQCPWDVLPGLEVCQFHRPAKIQELKRRTALLKQYIAVMAPEWAQEDQERKAQDRAARIAQWHEDRRRERRDAAEARWGQAQESPGPRQDCNRCARSLPLEAFHVDRSRASGRARRCAECTSEVRRARSAR